MDATREREREREREHADCGAAGLILLSKACVSLAKCGGNYLVRQAGSAAGFSGFSDLVLSKDDGSPQFRMQATFHLRRVARAGYRLADPYHAGQESPVFTIALGLPTEITGAEQPGQSETCWLDPASLVLPEELCQASETHWTCPDSAMGGCCMPGHCSADVVMASCGGPALALVTAGTCTDVRCTPIEELGTQTTRVGHEHLSLE